MAMRLSGARLATRGSSARLAMRGNVARLAMRGSGARRNTSAQKRTVRTLAFWSRQPEAPAPAPVPAAPALDLTMLLGIAVAIFTSIMSVQSIIKSELTPKLDTIGKAVAANSSKLDSLNAKWQAQQIQTADMQGQVGVLREVVTGTRTPTATKK